MIDIFGCKTEESSPEFGKEVDIKFLRELPTMLMGNGIKLRLLAKMVKDAIQRSMAEQETLHLLTIVISTGAIESMLDIHTTTDILSLEP